MGCHSRIADSHPCQHCTRRGRSCSDWQRPRVIYWIGMVLVCRARGHLLVVFDGVPQLRDDQAYIHCHEPGLCHVLYYRDFFRSELAGCSFHTFVPQVSLSFASISSAVALLGATISPYTMFWQV